jgi:hypothetical protein
MQYSVFAQGHCNTVNCKGYFCHHKHRLGPHRPTQFFKIRNTRRTNIFLSYFSSRQAFYEIASRALGISSVFGLRQELDKHRRGEVGRKVACPCRTVGPGDNEETTVVGSRYSHFTVNLCLHTSLILVSVQTNC